MIKLILILLHRLLKINYLLLPAREYLRRSNCPALALAPLYLFYRKRPWRFQLLPLTALGFELNKAYFNSNKAK